MRVASSFDALSTLGDPEREVGGLSGHATPPGAESKKLVVLVSFKEFIDRRVGKRRAEGGNLCCWVSLLNAQWNIKSKANRQIANIWLNSNSGGLP